MPGVNPDGYGDWRDMTIAEALSKLRGLILRGLVCAGLIEYDGDRRLAPDGWCRECSRQGFCDLSPRCGRAKL